jgi:3-hydroxy-9,10-secoandrosta-1,3,5(10)-triene-9,17-dione monooxygenase reductase component
MSAVDLTLAVSASPESFKQVLSAWPSGVSVVTTNHEGMLYGLTVSSFSSLSLDPPLVLVCLQNANRMADMIRHSGGFAVSILGSDQEAASNYFARPGREPSEDFTEIDGAWTEWDQPVVKDALGHLVCDLHALIPQGDHTITIGRVVGAQRRDGVPLVYHDRRYRTLS